MGMLYEYDSIEQDIINSAGKRLADEIDFQILSDMLVGIGWHKVILSPMSTEDSYAVDEWTKQHVKGHFETMGLVWVFENPQEAIWFTLRWMS
jgi:hypothetical protein